MNKKTKAAILASAASVLLVEVALLSPKVLLDSLLDILPNTLKGTQMCLLVENMSIG